MRDEWLVLDLCVGMVIAILTVLSSVPSGISISDDCSQQKETDENAVWQNQMKRARTPCRISKIRTTAWNSDGSGVICRSEKPSYADGSGATCRRETCRRWWNWCGLRAQELHVVGETAARSNLVCVKTWPSIVETAV